MKLSWNFQIFKNENRIKYIKIENIRNKFYAFAIILSHIILSKLVIIF